MPRVPRPNKPIEGRSNHTTKPATIELATYASGGGAQEMTAPGDGNQPKWSRKPHQTQWPPVPRKPVCACAGSNDLYVRLELLETRAAHQTKPVANAGVDFPFIDDMNNSGKFNLKNMGLESVHLRVIIYDEDWGDDRLLGYFNKVNLKPLRQGMKFVEVPTEQDGVFTGYVYIEFSLKDNDRTLAFKILGCKEINNMPPEAQCDTFKVAIGVFVCSYILMYAVVMGLVENPNWEDEACSGDEALGTTGSWSRKFDDILWFVLVTFSSVGYGDYYPCTDNGRIANGIFIILNQLTLAWFFTVATQLLIMQSTFVKVTMNAIYETYFQPTGEQHFVEDQDVLTRDKDGDMRTAKVIEVMKKFDEVEGDVDFSYRIEWEDGTGQAVRLQEEMKANQPLTFERLNQELKRKMLIQGGIVTFFVVLGMVVFHETENDDDTGIEVTWAQTFHFSIVTMSTVGYGDWAPVSRAGRVFGAFYILAGVSLLANFAGILVDHFIKERELKFSHKFLNNSLVTPKQLLQFDTNGDGSVDRYEYLVRSLVACRFVEEDKIDLIMTKFYNIDSDKSGTISLEDFKEYDKKVSSKNITVE